MDQSVSQFTNSVKFDGETDRKFSALVQRFGRSKRELLGQVIDYFYRTKKDPADISDEALKTSIIRNHKEYVGFIKTQEGALLIPIKQDVADISKHVGALIDLIEGQLAKQTQALLSAQRAQAVRVDQILAHSELMVADTHKTDRLKERFKYILRAYIAARDSFSLMTPAKEKDELAKLTFNQIELL
ncbi:BfmA/BtgA family mobilization protein [Pedobacter sp. SYP-B3415]|uniref:BfmA/BtgA family mobilization protein n=1 Tax=Pedobacter sp. SYP-B3415 TaxID=2496641 RepID=UPI00101BD677|nr:BfmA/BtgA family mobilization protein [Pedobacter sp. SYP-B3415]